MVPRKKKLHFKGFFLLSFCLVVEDTFIEPNSILLRFVVHISSYSVIQHPLTFVIFLRLKTGNLGD